MRSSMYDYNGWSRDSGMVPQKWEPGEAPAPYGDVPGSCPPEPEEPRGRRTPSLWRKAEKKKTRSGKRPLPREENGTGGFCLVLALLLILTGVAVYFQGGILPGEAPVEQFRDPSGGWSRYYGAGEETDWVGDLDSISMERAPLRDDVTLTLAPMEGMELTAREIYQRVSPSMVGIRVAAGDGIHLGTGIIMTGDGYIVTNAHILSEGREASVIFSNNSQAEALLVGYDGETDVAVLKVDRQGLTPAVFGDSSRLQVGDLAYAIGNPLGEELRGTMTSGIISAVDRVVDMGGRDMTLLQTSAALNVGNSGGALINAAGQVVGITNMKMETQWETVEGLGFAVPSSIVKPVVDQIIAQGSYVGRPAVGVTVIDHFDFNNIPDGAEVFSVTAGSDAEGKLFVGDVIVEANGEPIRCVDDLLRVRGQMAVGEELPLRVWTGGADGQMLEITITLQRSLDHADGEQSYTQRETP